MTNHDDNSREISKFAIRKPTKASHSKAISRLLFINKNTNKHHTIMKKFKFGTVVMAALIILSSCGASNTTKGGLIGLQAVVGHHCAFLGEAFHVFCLAAEEALGDEEGEVGILHACLLKHVVQHSLHLLPYSVTVRFDNHTSSHVSLLRKVGLDHKFIIPF